VNSIVPHTLADFRVDKSKLADLGMVFIAVEIEVFEISYDSDPRIIRIDKL
jgi:hypothetical protein